MHDIWTDEIARNDAYLNTPEQRAAALVTVTAFADTATLPELVAMLGLAES